jgi:hypothetical protein
MVDRAVARTGRPVFAVRQGRYVRSFRSTSEMAAEPMATDRLRGGSHADIGGLA